MPTPNSHIRILIVNHVCPKWLWSIYFFRIFTPITTLIGNHAYHLAYVESFMTLFICIFHFYDISYLLGIHYYWSDVQCTPNESQACISLIHEQLTFTSGFDCDAMYNHACFKYMTIHVIQIYDYDIYLINILKFKGIIIFSLHEWSYISFAWLFTDLAKTAWMVMNLLCIVIHQTLMSLT